MGVSDTTEKDWEEHHKEYLASVTEEYKIGYNKAIDDALEEIDSIYFGGGAREMLACSNATKNYIRHSIEKLKVSDNNESV